MTIILLEKVTPALEVIQSIQITQRGKRRPPEVAREQALKRLKELHSGQFFRIHQHGHDTVFPIHNSPCKILEEIR